MLSAALAGLLAGLAVALPLGGIGVLIVELGARGGFRAGFAAGLGTALCDGIYAVLAVAAGAAVHDALDGHERAFAIASALVLAAIGVVLLVRALRPAAPAPRPLPPAHHLTLRFLGLTAINPLTAAIFATLVAGDPDLADGPAEAAAFVAGVFAASLACQSALAGAGAVLHRRLPPAALRRTGLVAGALLLALALRSALAA